MAELRYHLPADAGGQFLPFQVKRVERNHNLIKEVKRRKGHTCEACGFSFEKQFRDIGRGFIEAHHLTPLSELEGTRIQLDPNKDFVVLCSNCHRMIHKSQWISDLLSFKKAGL